MLESGIYVYRDYSRCVIRPGYTGYTDFKSGRPPRGRITGLSYRSRRRMVDYLSGCVASYNYMGTFTLGGQFSSDGVDFKRRLNVFLRFMLDTLKRSEVSNGGGRPSSIFWFLEFQKRGAPHIHTFHTGYIHWKTLARKWAELFDSPQIEKTCSKIEKISSGRGGLISYARKYAAKESQKAVPDGYENVGRFWGVRGEKTVLSADKTFSEHFKGVLRRDLWESVVKPAELQGKVRVFRWKRSKGVTIVARGDNNLLDIGVIDVIDNLMIEDLLGREMSELIGRTGERLDARLRRQRRLFEAGREGVLHTSSEERGAEG